MLRQKEPQAHSPRGRSVSILAEEEHGGQCRQGRGGEGSAVGNEAGEAAGRSQRDRHLDFILNERKTLVGLKPMNDIIKHVLKTLLWLLEKHLKTLLWYWGKKRQNHSGGYWGRAHER